MKKLKLKVVFVAIGILLAPMLLALPLFFYVKTFGSNLSDAHARWAEMGSAMSGIYGPILAFLAFAVLTVQLVLQNKTTKHMFDMSFVQTAHAEIAFYVSSLDTLLSKEMANGRTVGEEIYAMYGNTSLDRLRDPSLNAEASALNLRYPQISAAWIGIQMLCAGLSATDDRTYRMHLNLAMQRARVVLSDSMCVTLDQYIWCLFPGQLYGPYLFSRLQLTCSPRH